MSAGVDESQQVLLPRCENQLVSRALRLIVEIDVCPLDEKVVCPLWPLSLIGLHYLVRSLIEPVGERDRPEVNVVL